MVKVTEKVLKESKCHDRSIPDNRLTYIEINNITNPTFQDIGFLYKFLKKKFYRKSKQ